MPRTEINKPNLLASSTACLSSCAAKKETASTRSFGRPITELADLPEAVSAFASRAAEKLSRQNGKVARVMTFMHTSASKKQDKQYSRSIVVPLRRPTAGTALIADAAVSGLREVFMPGLKMAKAGIHLLDIQDGGIAQHELALVQSENHRSALMTTLDRLNKSIGRGTVSWSVLAIRASEGSG